MKRVWLGLLLSLLPGAERTHIASAQTPGWSTNGPEGGTITALESDPQAPTTLYAATWNTGIFKSTDGGERWINVGLLDTGVDALALDPQIPDIIYAGTYNGGIFKSTTGGGSWSAVNTGLTTTSVLSLAIDPHDSATLYAGTINGIFKSTDGGNAWNPVKTWIRSASVLALAIDPRVAGTVYAGRSDTGGVVKSTDGGNTWNDTGLTGRHVYDLALDPSASSVLYASTFNGVFKSADAGSTWVLVSSGLNALNFYALVMDSEATTLYLGTENGAFKSIDGGTSWGAVNSGLPDISVLALAIDSQNPGTVYAGSHAAASSDWREDIGVFKTTDGGNSWTAANKGLVATSVLDVVVDPHTPTTAYAGGNRGVFKTTDQGASWTRINVGLTHPAYRLAIDPRTPDTLYGGTGNGVFKSIDGGLSWVAASTGLTNPFVQTLTLDRGSATTLYAGTLRGLFKSTDGAASWTPVDLGMGDSVRVFSFTIDPQVSTILYATAFDQTRTYPGGTFKSEDGGASWTRLSPMFLAVAVDPRNSSTLYGNSGDSIWKSTDGGATWNASNAGLPAMSVRALAIDSQAPATIYAAGDGGVFQSTDGGANWTDFNQGLINRSVNALAIDATVLLAGTVGGAFSIALTPDSPPTGILTIGQAGDGAGTITSNPPGIDCGDDCSEPYPIGTPVTLAAAPASGSIFTGWTGCESVDGTTCQVTVTAAALVSVRFDRQRFVLTAHTSGPGRGTVTSSPSGIDCGADCSEAFVIGATVTLTARPSPGSILTGWSGCDAASGGSCVVTMGRERSVTASFLGLPFSVRPGLIGP